MWLLQIDLLGYLRQLQNTCTFCLIHSTSNNNPDHSILTCPTLLNKEETLDEFMAWKKQIHYRVGVVHPFTCFICHVPQGLDDILHQRFDGVPEHCVFRDVIAPLVYGILTSTKLSLEAQDRFSFADFSTPMIAINWINSVSIAPGYPTNLVALFLWYCSHYL